MADKIKVYKFGSEPKFPSVYDVVTRKTLNYTDIISNSNKYYNTEIQLAQNGECRIFTEYGRLGAPNPAKEFRYCDDKTSAETLLAKIIKEKTKKGYVEVELVQAEVGSDIGKAKVEAHRASAVDLEKSGIKFNKNSTSKLHEQVQALVGEWFNATAEFIEVNLDTKRCPLGQLSITQIAKGRDILDECRKLIQSSKKPIDELNRLTSQYYANIPHNFGFKKLDADSLRFDEDVKIDKGLDILNVFLDAKNAENVLSSKNSVDAQYDTLNADISYIDSNNIIYKWLDRMFHETRAHNHSGLGKIKLHRAFQVNRKNEENYFLKTAEQIAKQCGKQVYPDALKRLAPERPDLSKELFDIYQRSNIMPLWHGTRRANMVGITTKGLLIRPSGVVHAGAAYGSGVYWSQNSSKSINYCDVRGSYWAQGNNKKGFLFLANVALGKQKIVNNSGYYTLSNIKPNHSVWAQAGRSGVINDEFITYTPSGPEQQHQIKYILEFETQVK